MNETKRTKHGPEIYWPGDQLREIWQQTLSGHPEKGAM